MKIYQKLLIITVIIFLFISQQILFHIEHFNKIIDYKLRQIYKVFISPPKKEVIPSEVTLEILETLKEGNNTIYMIHNYNHPPGAASLAIWERSHDLLSLFENNLEKPEIIENTCLKPKGKVEAENVKKIFQIYKIPVGKVYSSPLCRNKETAILAFGKITSEYHFLLYPDIMQSSDIERNKKWLNNLFYEKPENGNKVIVGHGGIITEWLGFPEDINQSGMFIYNHKLEKPILQLTYLDIVKMYYLKK